MSRIPPALAYLVIYNPTLQPSPEDLAEGRDEDDVIEQAHVLFYTARERAVSRDRILRQVGLAKALANFAEMFTSQSGFDNVHAQKSRLVTISPEPNFWIHACVNVAKTPKATAKSVDGADDFDYHNNSLNDEVLRTQMLHAFQAFKLQYGGFTHVMQTEGVRVLERQVEAFFTPWAWQWDVGATPEFGNYLGLSVHPLKNQLNAPINEYVSRAPDTPTLILSPPHIITGPNMLSIPASRPLSRLLEPFVPPPAPKQQNSPSSATTTTVSTSAPMHMLTASGNAVTKYITKPAAQVVDPRNWGWPALPFGKGSTRAKGKSRGKIPTTEDAKAEVKESPNPTGASVPEPSHSSDLLGLPTDVESVSRASRSISPSTIDHESLLDAQQDYIPTPVTYTGSTEVDAASIPLPAGSDSDLTSTSLHSDDGHVAMDEPISASVAPPAPVASSSSSIRSQNEPTHSSGTQEHVPGTESSNPHLSVLEPSYEPKATETTSESLQSTPLATMHIALPTEEQTPVLAVTELAPVQVQSLTQLGVDATSGSVYVWLDSPAVGGKEMVVRKRRVDWVAVPGLLVASILDEDKVLTWKDVARQLLLSIDEIIQTRQLTAAETTLRALNTTKVIAHYPASQLSASSSLPKFTSESPLLFSSARALQFAAAPGIREIVTHTRWGTWCAARQSTIRTRIYIEVDRKDANLVDVDHELGSACSALAVSQLRLPHHQTCNSRLNAYIMAPIPVRKPKEVNPLPLESTLGDLSTLRAQNVDLTKLLDFPTKQSGDDGLDITLKQSHDFVGSVRTALGADTEIATQGDRVEAVRATLQEIEGGFS